jgi:N utilization substance protein A
MNGEMKAMVEYYEREHKLDRETIIRTIEEALMAAARKAIRMGSHLRVEIDRKSLQIRTFATYKVAEGRPTSTEEISLAEARRHKPDAQPGETIEVLLAPNALGRIGAQTAKQLILQRIRDAERKRIYEEYKNTVGDIVSGTVHRFDRRDVIVMLDRAEAILPANERPSTEQYQIGDRIRALVLRVENLPSGPVITLSRSSPDFIRRLFELEVAEIADGTVEIRAIARDPGFRTKLAVYSRDEKVDPVGACVGLRGMRVQTIMRELSGERIDVVRWHPDIRQFVAAALHPAKLDRVTVDEATRTVHVAVLPDQLPIAIGKEGKNVRLAMKLTGWRIEIDRETGDLSFEEKVARAVADLAAVEGIGPQRAEALVKAGFLSLEGILAAEPSDLESVEGLDAATAMAVRKAAQAEYERRHGTVSS